MPIVNENLEVTYPTLPPGQPLLIPIHHDEMSVATNETKWLAWLADGQQPLHKKGNGQSVHVSNFILETTGCLSLTESQILEMKKLPLEKQLAVTDAHVIIHPEKNGDAWWDNT